MPCYHPLRALRDSDGIRFVASKEAYNLKLPCGQCIGCRLERSRQSAVRCMHEARMHRANCFLTLTIAPEHMPELAPRGSLDKRHHQLFLKRFRRHIERHSESSPANPPVGGGRIPTTTATESEPEGAPAAPEEAPVTAGAQNRIRYYMCGEYGAKLHRPHYHFCIFGFQFPDLKYWGKTTAGSKIYRSPTLEKLWPYGHSTVGALTFESAAYTARYVMKKINGKKQKEHYERIDPETGEIYQLLPEYTEASRRPGIGRSWIEKYTADVYDALPGKVIIRGKEANAPRYYDKQLEKWDPEKYELIKEHRIHEGRQHAADNTRARLAVRELVAEAKISHLKRTI